MEPVPEMLASADKFFVKYAEQTKRTFAETLLRAGRGVIRRGISITPPATASGIAGGLDTTAEARQRGYSAITRDLGTLFTPVRLKHKRKERISGADMVQIHRQALIRKRPGAKMHRSTPEPLFVDAVKLRQLNAKLRTHVGRLASGWMSAAAALQVTTPVWVSRHGAIRGTVHMDFAGSEMFVEAINYAPNTPFWVRSETQRRVDAALRYQLNAMQLELEFLALKRAEECGATIAAA